MAAAPATAEEIWRDSLATCTGLERPSFCQDCQHGCTLLLSGLNGGAAREVADLLESLPTLHLDRGQEVVHCNMPMLGIYIVCEGGLKLLQRSSAGRCVILNVLGPGDVLGEECAVPVERHGWSAQSLTPVTLKFLEAGQFRRLLRAHPTIRDNLLRQLVCEIKSLQHRYSNWQSSSAERRVSYALLYLIGKLALPSSGTVALCLTRADLADVAGISSETTIRTLQNLQKQRLVKLKHRCIEVVSRRGLSALLEPARSDA